MIAEVATRADVGAVFVFLLVASGVWAIFLTCMIDSAKRDIIKALEQKGPNP